MSIALFAVRYSVLGLIGALVLIVLVVWFAIRVVADGVTWFREEILGDFQRQQRKARKKAKDPENKN